MTETVDAKKVRMEGQAALAVLAGVRELIVARGKKVETFDLKTARPTDEELLAKLLGPTGNLRAPTARVGRRLLVGFNPEMYERVLGK